MRSLIPIVVLVVFSAVPATAQPIPSGTEAYLKTSAFVTIKNPEGTFAGSGIYRQERKFNQMCRVEMGEEVRFLAERDGMALVRYFRTWRSGDVPNICDSHTLFWIPMREFRLLMSNHGRTVGEEAEIEEIRVLLKPKPR